MLLQQPILALVNGVGLLALLAISFGAIERQHWSRMARSLVQGAVFGVGAVLAMMSPAHLSDGVLVDARALIVGFAAAFGGWPAALVAVVIGATYRMFLGGAGAVPGAAGIVAAALLGLAWRYWLRPKTRVRAQHLVVLGLVVSCYLLVALAMGYSTTMTLLNTVGPYMVMASVGSSVLLGLFVERELNQIAREEHWKTRALTDPLTGLPNRRAFERGMQGLRKPDAEAALLIADLDHFKVVNDTHGHAAGDHVLQEISEALRHNVRGRDLLSRLGGEELAVLLPDTGYVRARQIANRLRRSIEALDIEWEGHIIKITISIGVAVASGNLSSDDLFEQADSALYAAKRGGRNRVVFSGASLMQPKDEAAALAAVVARVPKSAI
ncbi:hypothetical protein WH87_14740 [Devosia epidermidihirudinis]|uniref:diguanylate cyclase n=1 Tax=Devosia epidermidihirudinis TaxID=1293439 RepID=A0A0F5Q6Z6_9HYPH|nr:diguanylate cyclase [Devosia epidermidihirudinis]KKC35829.1 hypothetical protein WH87_14740 [Devosia epidermidihirudinis]